MKRLFAAPRRVLAVGVLAAVAVVVAAGFGYAAVAADNQTYSGCLQNGDLTNVAIGSTPVRACPKNAIQINWSQSGTPGTPGTPGTNGTNGVSVTSETEAAGANCADGGSKFTAANGVTYACNGAKGDKGDKGDKGIQGDKGDPGALAGSLAGVPCDTGSLDRPDGETKVAVAPTTGVITLTCVSASTNPTLVVWLDNILVGSSLIGYGGLSEVDASGVPVPKGFTCQRSNLVPTSCRTQRFAPGSTVYLRTSSNPPAVGYGPVWTGCDSISTDRLTCTLTLPAAGTVSVTLTAG